MKKVILLAVTLVVAVCLAFGTDLLFYALSDREKTEIKGSAIFTDGREAYGIYDCEVVDGMVFVTGGDPQFVVSGTEEEISVIRMAFIKPVEQDTNIQLFYLAPGDTISEDRSVRTMIPAGAKEKEIWIPSAVYGQFRFDIEDHVVIRDITAGNEYPVIFVYHPHGVRIALLAAEFFLLFYAVRFFALREEKGKRTGKHAPEEERKPIWAIALCNLFLALTVMFFQPVSSALAFGPFAVGNVWGLGLLLAFGAAAVLSGLMMLLPVRAGIAASAFSLGAGGAFLVQSVLWNEGRYLRMDTSFPLQMLNIIAWFGIILMAFVLGAYCTESREQQKTAKKTLCIFAVILLMIQGMDYTVLQTRMEGDPLPAGYREEWTRKEASGGAAEEDPEALPEASLGDLLTLSLRNGMPFYLK